jgi:hypothetical protein
MLFNKKAQLYTYTRDANQVSTYTAGAMFACAIQPVGTKDGFEQGTMYNVKKMYTQKSLRVGDKLVIDGIDYIVNNIEDWQGTKRNFYKVIIQKSNGS